MGKGRFLNQKLGKRASRKLGLLKARLPHEKPPGSKQKTVSGKGKATQGGLHG